MRQIKWLTPYIIVLSIIFILSACGTSLQKPTGLEDNENGQTENLHGENENTTNNQIEDNFAEDEANTNDDPEIETELAEESSEVDSKSLSNETTIKNKQNEKDNNKSTQKKQNLSQSKSENNSKHKKNTKSTSNKSKDKSKVNKADKKKKEKKKDSSSTENSGGKESSPNQSKDTITISIVISSNEIPLAPTEIEIDKNDTVFDAFKKVTEKRKIPRQFTGSGAMAYIQGIGGVGEFDRGPGSGWMYRVNGVFPNRGVGVVPVMDGDKVEFLYTTNLGEDLGADLKPFR